MLEMMLNTAQCSVIRMEEDSYFEDEDEELETCSYEDMYKGIPYSRILKNPPVDEEKEKVIDEIQEWDRLLNKLQQKKNLRPTYQTYDYQSKNLYKSDKESLKKILENIIRQIHAILFQLDVQPSTHPNVYTKRYPTEPTKYPYSNSPLLKYYYRHIAPLQVLSSIFPPFLNEVSLDEYDQEHLRFITQNIQFLSQIPVLNIEYQLENRKLRKEDLIKLVRKDLLQRHGVDPQLRKEVEDEVIRYELSHKPEKQQKQLLDIYRKYCEVMAERRKDEERQQELLRNQGLKRREELQRRLEGKPAKEKEKLGEDAARAIIKAFSRKKQRRKSDE